MGSGSLRNDDDLAEGAGEGLSVLVGKGRLAQAREPRRRIGAAAKARDRRDDRLVIAASALQRAAVAAHEREKLRRLEREVVIIRAILDELQPGFDEGG